MEGVDINYTLLSILTESHHLYVPTDFDIYLHGDELKLEIKFEFEGDEETNELLVKVYQTIYWNKNKTMEKDFWIKMFDITVDSKYEIEKLKNYIDDKKTVFKPELLIKFAHLSASHARGVQSVLAKDTPLQLIYISTKKVNNFLKTD